MSVKILNKKMLKDWTVAELILECELHKNCEGCTFNQYELTGYGECFLNHFDGFKSIIKENLKELY